MSLRRKNQTLTIVIAMFLAMLLIMTLPVSMHLGIIEDKPFIGSVTTGDILTIFCLFGTCVTIAVWITSRRKWR